MSESQLEVLIAEYLLLHADCLKPIVKLSTQYFDRYQSFIQEEYETSALFILRDQVASGLKESYPLVAGVLDKQFVERVLGSDFLKYERVAP